MQLAEMTWPKVESYLKSKDIIILPVGSTEQHGPTGLIGTDYQCSLALAQGLAQDLDIICAPSLNYGMAEHHMAFPGTCSLKPNTYIQVLCELIQSYVKHGFKKIFLINGHGGNIPCIQTAFCQLKSENIDASFYLENWWRNTDLIDYEQQQFGDKNGFHATCGEVSLTQFLHPEAFKDLKEFKYSPESQNKNLAWPMGANEYRKHFPDGSKGSDPSLASFTHGEKIFMIVKDSIKKTILDLK